jgi:hypothetical protein
MNPLAYRQQGQPDTRRTAEKLVDFSCVHMREWAQTLLYFDAGWEAKAIAAQQELHLDAVYDRRKHRLAKIATSPLSSEARICLLYRGSPSVG